MKKKVEQLLQHKDKTIPILSFPSTQLLDISVKELISSAEMQVNGMQAIAERCDIGASLNMMDLSVEAECFGATIRFSDDEVPTVEQGVIDDIEDAANLVVPPVGSGRTSLYLEGVKLAKERMQDRLVFCGAIGPYSLAGRLFDMTELMMACYDSPDQVHVLLRKSTDFITQYILAFRDVDADGVIIAEPAAGLLSPELAEEFSMPYVQQIIQQVNRDDFVICYHNCGNAVGDMTDLLHDLDADIFHFGNAVDMRKMVPCFPTDKIVMGNVDPVLFRTGTAEDVCRDVERIYHQCAEFENFMISTGCDVPAGAKWENIDAYFEKVAELYASGND